MAQERSQEWAQDRAQDVAEGARELAVRVRATAEPAAERAVEVLEQVGSTVGTAVATTLVPAVRSAVDTSVVRGGAAWDALRGGPVVAPVGVRRWPWALGAALLGAAAGGVVALAVRRIVGDDAPDALAPEDVQAVVDRPVDLPPVR